MYITFTTSFVFNVNRKERALHINVHYIQLFTVNQTSILKCRSRQLPVQLVPITTILVSSNPVHGKVYSIQYYVIKFVSDLRQVSGFLWVLPVSSTNKTDCHDIKMFFKMRGLFSVISHRRAKLWDERWLRNVLEF
jgi:hypothetical protein